MRIAGRDLRIRRALRHLSIVASAAVCVVMFSDLNSETRSAVRNPLPHKVHLSVTNLEFNQAKQSVDIVIRVFTDDLENALSHRASGEVKIDLARAQKDKRFGEQVMGYLRSNFELKNKTGRPINLTWSGIEGQMDMYWLYVKGRMPGGFEGARMRNKLFCELFEDQVNIVNAKHQGKQIGLMFESKDDFKAIR